MIGRLAAGRCARAAAALLSAGALAACSSSPVLSPSAAEELLAQFRSGQVRLDCSRCRFDFRGADWMLEDGHYEPLVIAILRSRDGSGRSWYLLGRVAEATGSPELAIRYYRESMVTSRRPIIALWPLYDDVNYRIRRLLSPPSPETASAVDVARGTVEKVSIDSLAVATRPGPVGAFVAKLGRGDSVEVLERSGDWERVRLADGRIGWIWGAYTSVSGEPGVSARAEPKPRSQPRRAQKPRAKQRVARKASPAAKPTARPEPSPAPRVAATPKPSPAPKPAAAPKPSQAPAATRTAAVVPPSAPPSRTADPAPTSRASAPAPTPRRVHVARPIAARQLVAGGRAGIQGCPLPQGASLSGRTHGSAGVDDHPTETYSVEAPAREIVRFYEREMERAGWHKAGVSSELLLYFVKDEETVGVLIDRDGGFFTLMGS